MAVKALLAYNGWNMVFRFQSKTASGFWAIRGRRIYTSYYDFLSRGAKVASYDRGELLDKGALFSNRDAQGTTPLHLSIITS